LITMNPLRNTWEDTVQWWHRWMARRWTRKLDAARIEQRRGSDPVKEDEIRAQIGTAMGAISWHQDRAAIRRRNRNRG